jgi:hypothetical protein
MDGHNRQDELREHALNMLASAVAHFDEAGFDPDAWQGWNLAQAFNEMTRGCYSSAAISVRDAILPKHERPLDKLPNDFGTIDRRLLSRLLENARAEPVRQFPHHGPLVYEENGARGLGRLDNGEHE